MSYPMTTTVPGVFAMNIYSNATVAAANSEIAVVISLDGSTVSFNYAISSIIGAGYAVSTSAFENVLAGSHTVQFCVEGRDLSAWKTHFSYNYLQ